MRYLTLLALAVFLMACGDSATTAESMEDSMEDTAADMRAETESMANTASAEGANMLQSTISAVQSAGGDLTALSPDAAVNNINGWVNQLRKVDGTDGMINELNSLRTELQSGNINGSRVSGILSNLASQTRSMSDRAPGLSTLADALEAGANKLAGK